MRFRNFCSLALVAFLAMACSTTVNTRQALEPNAIGNLRFSDVKAASSLSNVTPDDISRLEAAVSSRLVKLPQGNMSARIQLSITQFDIESGVTRFFVGALAGSNKMTVAVRLTDVLGNTIADFDVQRSSNPGGYGALYSQTTATIDAVADGITEVLGGMSGAH